MNRFDHHFNAQDLSSRKLWELVSGLDDYTPEKTELEQAVLELAQRRHYLVELKNLGIYTLPRK